MRTRAALAPLVVGALIALGASAGASVATKTNGCKVLKASDVTRVTGLPAKKATQQPPAPSSFSVCGYSLTDPGQVRSVNIWVQPNDGTIAKIGFTTAKKAFADKVEPVSGFGKNAFFVGGGLNTLYVLKGDTLLYVQYVAFGDPDAAGIKTKIEQLTKAALARV
jgi:hypothetical protein